MTGPVSAIVKKQPQRIPLFTTGLKAIVHSMFYSVTTPQTGWCSNNYPEIGRENRWPKLEAQPIHLYIL